MARRSLGCCCFRQKIRECDKSVRLDQNGRHQECTWSSHDFSFLFVLVMARYKICVHLILALFLVFIPYFMFKETNVFPVFNLKVDQVGKVKSSDFAIGNASIILLKLTICSFWHEKHLFMQNILST